MFIRDTLAGLRNGFLEKVDYLRIQGIVHALAHPLYSINDRLQPEHIEQTFLLFQNFELNGCRDHYQNSVLKNILKALTQADLLLLADKYKIDRPVEAAPNIAHFTDTYYDINGVALTLQKQVAISIQRPPAPSVCRR